jgi:hypothetical protein
LKRDHQPEVTFSPWLISWKTADMLRGVPAEELGAEELDEGGAARVGGGGGGPLGGGGGGPEDFFTATVLPGTQSLIS